MSAVVSAQTASTLLAPANRFVAIGCLTRQGTASQPRFVVVDTRQPSTTYRLSGDAALLAPHVGHAVEVVGPITAAGTQPTLKVNSLTWLASTCKK